MKTCPNKEEISTWVDGENPQDLAPHIKTCAGCSRLATQYRAINKGVSADIANIQASDSLLTQINSAIKENELSSEKPDQVIVVDFTRLLMRVAAVAIICGVTYILIQPDKNLPAEEIAKNQDTQKSNSFTISDNNNIDNSSLVSPVSINKSNSSEINTLITIPANVSHTWGSSNSAEEMLEQTRKELLVISPDANITINRETAPNTIEVHVSLKDHDLVQLIDHFYNLHDYDLLNSEKPEPEDLKNLKTNGATVNYKIKLIKTLN